MDCSEAIADAQGDASESLLSGYQDPAPNSLQRCASAPGPTTKLFRKACLSSCLPIRSPYANSCLHVTVVITAFRALTLTTPPLTPAPQNALRELCFTACPPRHPSSHPRNSHPSSRPRPKSSLRYPSNSSVARLAPVIFGLDG